MHLLHNIAVGGHGDGYSLTAGTGWVLTGNLASATVTGFSLAAGPPYTVTGNVAIGNETGIRLTGGSGHVVTGNEVLGNKEDGIIIEIGASAVVHKNNLFGNMTNCGLTNITSTVDAANNFWGAATGPGPNPADNTCGTGGVTVTAPFATKAFFIKLPVLP